MSALQLEKQTDSLNLTAACWRPSTGYLCHCLFLGECVRREVGWRPSRSEQCRNTYPIYRTYSYTSDQERFCIVGSIGIHEFSNKFAVPSKHLYSDVDHANPKIGPVYEAQIIIGEMRKPRIKPGNR